MSASKDWTPQQFDPLDEPGGEQAAAKMWAVYVSEAEKYDRSLVESWRSDMEGMLIFAGLFSASLTAFIIESYRTLRMDSSDATVELLVHISRQLANDTSIAAPVVEYSPPRAAILCNTLWFISLGLSLSCALIATLLEQWARDFLHRADMRSSPIIRARIYSFLFYGLKRFKMHVVVDVIPLLLHASLLLFFAGLFAFLYPINPGIAAVSAAILGIVAGVYAALTVLPLVQLDCPYRTPLSNSCWSMSVWFSRLMTPKSWPKDTLLEAMSSAAMDPTAAQAERDKKALIWTFKSLADDSELEPFVESIPDVLWGQRMLRGWTIHMCSIRQLLQHPDVQLLARIEELRNSCYSGLLLPDALRRRYTTCNKALWALGSLPLIEGQHSTTLAREWCSVAQAFGINPDIPGHETQASTEAMLQFAAYRNLRPLIPCLLAVAQKHRLGIFTTNLQSHPADAWAAAAVSWVQDWGFLRTQNNEPGTFSTQFADDMYDWEQDMPYAIVFHYIHRCSVLHTAPYRWIETLRIELRGKVSPSLPPQFCGPPDDVLTRRLAFRIEMTLDTLVKENIDKIASDTTDILWHDDLILFTSSFWKPVSPTALPSGLIRYLTHCKNPLALNRLLRLHSHDLWRHLPPTIAASWPQELEEPLAIINQYPPLTQVMQAMWCMATDGTFMWDIIRNTEIETSQSIFQMLDDSPPTARNASPSVDFSVTALLRSLFFNAENREDPADDHPLNHDSAQRDQRLRRRRQDLSEATMSLFCEFLERISQPDLPQPFRAAETLRALSYMACPPYLAVPAPLQQRLAQSLRACAAAAVPNGKHDLAQAVLEAAFESRLFHHYAMWSADWPRSYDVRPVEGWIDDAVAREQMVKALQTVAGLSLNEQTSRTVQKVLERVRAEG
ncbi:hypothetical protein MKEN_00923200 [Mycena kentingensis (nom. inval.)]|nr:hypothetical protein MKEN_00923200 [Mycena kentingensis (nom. inval.)]